MFRTAISRSRRDVGGGVAREVQRERVGARLDRPRELVAGDPERERHERHRQGQRGQRGRPGTGVRVVQPLAPAEALGKTLGQQRAGRRDEGEPGEPAEQVVVVLVAELVGHHLEHLIAWEALDEVVVEHHPLRVPEPVHVGVHPGGAAARVHAVDLPHVHVGLARQLEHLRSERPPGQRLELVEDRVDHHGEEPDGDHPHRHHDHRARHPPAAAEATDERQPERTAHRREAGLEACRPGHVAEPWAPVLGGEAHVVGALVRDRRERQPYHDERRARCRRPRPRRPAAGASTAGRSVCAAAAARSARASRRSAPAHPVRSGAGGRGSPPPAAPQPG